MKELIKPISKIILKKLIKSMQERSKKQALEQWQHNFTQKILPEVMTFLEAPSEHAATHLLRESAESIRMSSSPMRESVLTWIQSGLNTPYSESRMTFILRRVLQCYDPATLSDLVSKGSGNSYSHLVNDLRIICGILETDDVNSDNVAISET